MWLRVDPPLCSSGVSIYLAWKPDSANRIVPTRTRLTPIPMDEGQAQAPETIVAREKSVKKPFLKAAFLGVALFVDL